MFGTPTASINGPANVEIDGASLPATVSTKSSHQVRLPDGRHCIVESHASGGFVALDIVLLFAFVVPGVIALAVDGSSGDWDKLDTSQCPDLGVE